MSGLDLDALEAQALAGDLQPHGRARLGDPMTRAKPGRPPGPPGSQRTALLRVRVSDAEREAYQAAAGRAGVSMGEWVRRALVPAAHACCGGGGMLTCERCNGCGEDGPWGGTCHECKGQGALPCSECMAAAEKEHGG